MKHGGKDMEGILPLWKPKGFTSHDCVMKIRRLYQTKKVGHTGTLDPEVEGVLPICIGQATKIVPFLTDTAKTYEAEVTIGYSTDTEDSYGEIIERTEKINLPDISEVTRIVNSFQGEIIQIPPMYSAVKVNGKKLYEYARAGIKIERPERKVTIHEIELLKPPSQKENGNITFVFRAVCSKGTYIRTLAVDIGKALGYPAHMSHLVRLQTGDFCKDDCVTLEEIEKTDQGESRQALLFPMKKGLNHLDVVQVQDSDVWKVQVGQKLPLPSQLPETDPFRVEADQKLLAIYQVHPSNHNEIKPVRVFNLESR